MLTYQRVKRQGTWITGVSLFLFALSTFMGLTGSIIFLPLILLIMVGAGWWCMGKAMEIDYKTENG